MKKKRINKYTLTKLAVIIGIVTFLVSLLIAATGNIIFAIIKNTGLITEKNWLVLWFADYIGLYILLGGLISLVAVHIPIKKMIKLIRAMEKISEGDFSVRLNKKKSFMKIIPRTVDMFNNMAGQLESTEMLSHDFINNFSHEFKTPIASINGFAKLLKNEKLTAEEKNEYLDIIIQESERLSNLSINILSLSKLEQQTILTNKTSFNVSEQIRIAIGSLYPKWTKKNLDIVFDGDDIFINANKEMLGQVWINLLDNAIKFSPENKEIPVRIEKQENSIYISLKNYGSTVPPEQISRIFDKFYQGDESHSTSGNGLGLPMVKRIVELHEGSVDVSCSDEPAVTFSVVLPTE